MSAEQSLDGHPAARPATAERAKRRRSRRWVPIGFAILVVLAIVNGSMRFFDKPLPADVDGDVHVAGLTDSVVAGPITYDLHPPAGGAHAAEVQACGVYRVPVIDENAVATLATGAVWIAYRPDLSAADVKALENLALGEEDMILAPYPGLDSPIVATAWGVQLRLDSPADQRLPLFTTIYTNSAQAPNESANCAEGVGAP